MPIQITPFRAKDPVQMSVTEWALYFNIYPYYWKSAEFLENYFVAARTGDILNQMELSKAAAIYNSFSSDYQNEVWPYLSDELKSYISFPPALFACLAKDGALGKRAVK